MKQKTKYITVNMKSQDVQQHRSLTTISNTFGCTPANISYMKQKNGFPFKYKDVMIYDRNTYNRFKRENASTTGVKKQQSSMNYDIKDSKGKTILSNLSQSVAQDFLSKKIGESILIPKGKFALPTTVKNYTVSEANGSLDIATPKPNIQTISQKPSVSHKKTENNSVNKSSREYLDTLVVDNKPLTDKQWDVLFCFMQGKTYVEIGDEIGKSPKTIAGHMRRIFTKFGVSSKKEWDETIGREPKDDFESPESPPQSVQVTPNIVGRDETPFRDVVLAIIPPDGGLFMSQNVHQALVICGTEYDILESHYERYGLPLELNNYKLYNSNSFNTNIMNNVSQPEPTIVPNRVVGDYYVYDINTQDVHKELTKRALGELLNEDVTTILSTGETFGFPVSVNELMVFDNANSLSVYKSFLCKQNNVEKTVEKEPAPKGWFGRFIGN